MAEKINNVVLVHGGFVDGSGWQGVFKILEQHGFNVSVVQNPTISLDGDVAAVKLVLDEQPGPAVLVGHSLRRRGDYAGRQLLKLRCSSTSRPLRRTKASR
jgi:hypothetical protein